MSIESMPPSHTPSRLKRAVDRHPVATFCVLALALTWLAVLPLLFGKFGWLGFPADLPVEPFQILGALAGPTLSSVIVTALTSGRAGLRGFFGKYVEWRAGWQWYLLVLIGPLLALNVIATVVLGSAIWLALGQNLPSLVSFYLPTLVLGVILGPLWEEPGWRGFALPRLQARYGPVVGTVVLGVVWGLWHLPGYLGGWLGDLTPARLVALLASTVGYSLIMTWVYNNTKGSLLIAILLHSANNAAIAFGGVLLPAELSPVVQAAVYTGWIPASTHLLFGLLLVLLTRGRLSYSPQSES
jgi:CAAX protease family protein